MNLSASIQNAIDEAKIATSDLWTTTVFKATAPSAYDTATGVVTSVTTSTTISMLIGSYSAGLVDGAQVLGTDVKATFLQKDLASTPDVNDLVTYASRDWAVISVKQDVANTLWITQLRAVL